MKQIVLFGALFIAALASASAAHAAETVLGRSDVEKRLPCAAPLVSHWIQERGFAKEVAVEYGPYRLVRTDVGDSDGTLAVYKDGKKLCTLPLSLNPDVFLSSTTATLILSAYSGSNDWYEFYALPDCRALGQTDKDTTRLTAKLLNEHTGKTCSTK